MQALLYLLPVVLILIIIAALFHKITKIEACRELLSPNRAQSCQPIEPLIRRDRDTFPTSQTGPEAAGWPTNPRQITSHAHPSANVC